MVDRGQADVLVAAAVAGDVVRVEQLVVVGAGGWRRRCRRRCRRRRVRRRLGSRAAVCAMSSRKAWPVRTASAVLIGRGGVALDAARCPVSRPAAGSRSAPRHELAVRVGREQRHVGDVGVGQARCRAASRACALTSAQVARPPVGAVPEQPAGRDAARSAPVARSDAARTRAGTPGARGARCRSGSGRRTASSVLVCSWTSSAVPRTPSGPGWLVARVSTMKLVGLPGDVERVVGLQRDEDRAAAALVHQVEAVVEELAEEREPAS